MSAHSETVIGLVADTHGALPAAAVRALAGAARILHAGDVEGRAVLAALARIAPVTAVRGNTDRGDCGDLPGTALVEVGGLSIFLLHDLGRLDLDPAAAGVRVVVHGHTHRAEVEERRGVLYVNPGSTTRPRGGGPASVALLRVGPGGAIRAGIVPVEDR